MRRRLTLKDVAIEAGVTPMTVSNVLNGRDNQVSRPTRERVAAVIERLDYRPHAAARRLRSQRANAIGVLVLDDVPQFLNDPFITQVVAGVSNLATAYGYSVLLQGVRVETTANAPLLAQLQTDGVCAILSGPPERRIALVERLIRLHVPLVLIQERSDIEGICSVRQDDHGGALQIARYLIERGARRLVFLAPGEEWPAMNERIAAVREVCAATGATLQTVTCGDETFAATQEALSTEIASNQLPDAFVGGNDRMAMAALKLLAQRGIDVPGEVQVTGFNNFDMAAYAVPRLVTVRSFAYEMGYRAGKEVLETIERGNFASKDIVLPVEFVDGDSA